MVYFQKLFWHWYFSRNCFQKRSKYENFTAPRRGLGARAGPYLAASAACVFPPSALLAAFSSPRSYLERTCRGRTIAAPVAG